MCYFILFLKGTKAIFENAKMHVWTFSKIKRRTLAKTNKQKCAYILL